MVDQGGQTQVGEAEGTIMYNEEGGSVILVHLITRFRTHKTLKEDMRNAYTNTALS
jgi:hypothetical protein